MNGWNFLGMAAISGVVGFVLLLAVGLPGQDESALPQLAAVGLCAVSVTLWLIGCVAVGVQVGSRPPQADPRSPRL